MLTSKWKVRSNILTKTVIQTHMKLKVLQISTKIASQHYPLRMKKLWIKIMMTEAPITAYLWTSQSSIFHHKSNQSLVQIFWEIKISTFKMLFTTLKSRKLGLQAILFRYWVKERFLINRSCSKRINGQL